MFEGDSWNQASIKELTQVFGVGEITAQKWANNLGITSLEELRTHAAQNPDFLTRSQHIGLEFVDDLKKKIPREEMTALRDKVIRTAREVYKGKFNLDDLMAEVLGSYRRGKAESGDIDIILCIKGRNVFLDPAPLIDKLTAQGFLLHQLSVPGKEHSRKHSTTTRVHGREFQEEVGCRWVS